MSDINVVTTGSFTKPVTTVAALPTASADNAGDIRWVSDLNSSRDTTKGQTAAGGGTVQGRVVSNGSAWKIYG